MARGRAGAFLLAAAAVAMAATGWPASGARNAAAQATPPFPTVPPTAPFPTLPPDIPTPLDHTPTPTITPPAPTDTPPASATPPPSPTAGPPTPTALVVVWAEVLLPYLAQFDAQLGPTHTATVDPTSTVAPTVAPTSAPDPTPAPLPGGRR